MIFLYVILVLCASEVQSEEVTKILNPHDFKKLYYTILSQVKPNISDHEVSGDCMIDVLETFAAIRRGEIWALKMLDAASKIQSGISDGNIVNLGAYDQCLSIHNKLEDREIKGKYCFFGILVNRIPKNFIIDVPQDILDLEVVPLMEAICVPDSCSAADLTVAFNDTGLTDILSLDSLFVEKFCQVKDTTVEFTPLHGFFLFLVFGDIFLMIICTAYDIYLRRTHKKPYHKSMISFSLYTNFKQLITVKKDPDQLSCIHGIRSLSMAWVILGHRYLIQALYPHFNYLPTLNWIQSKESTAVTGALFAIDTFFEISGCLVVYIVLLAKAKDFKFNLFHYFAHRILRLSPALIMLMLFYMTYMKNASSNIGPLWPIIYYILENGCEIGNWWNNLIFIQNTVNPSHACVLHSWYLAVDTQLYYLAPLLLFPLKKWPKPTLAAIVLLLLSSLIYGFVTAWDMQVSASPLALGGYFKELYANTIVRSNAWFIGGLLGYVLFITRGKRVFINKFVAVILWALSIGLMSWMVYLQEYFTNANYDRFTDTFYLTFSKPLWSLGQAWIIFACARGYSGFINAFLSNRFFVVIGRISYSMYLLHIVVIYFSICNVKTTDYFSIFNIMTTYWSDLLYTMLLGIIWSLSFESPIIALGKTLMNPEMVKRLEEIAEENETAFQQQEQLNKKEYVTRL